MGLVHFIFNEWSNYSGCKRSESARAMDFLSGEVGHIDSRDMLMYGDTSLIRRSKKAEKQKSLTGKRLKEIKQRCLTSLENLRMQCLKSRFLHIAQCRLSSSFERLTYLGIFGSVLIFNLGKHFFRYEKAFAYAL
ncbi:hypothetical protein FNV43_RR15141 [Rhamnella rubrinervis]|uniref:Uncharacterized protein n=1 Tax=Rhamnella rubrinervis TaxID=2594499 RepID=A0A8K0E779_9ROSA|nr:hypothetical protein FNV43_RR15141 [Rhamnella rubrinervis]